LVEAEVKIDPAVNILGRLGRIAAASARFEGFRSSVLTSATEALLRWHRMGMHSIEPPLSIPSRTSSGGIVVVVIRRCERMVAATRVSS
jgi:hypothetical protein